MPLLQFIRSRLRRHRRKEEVVQSHNPLVAAPASAALDPRPESTGATPATTVRRHDRDEPGDRASTVDSTPPVSTHRVGVCDTPACLEVIDDAWRMVVRVEAARSLMAHDMNGASDPYAEIRVCQPRSTKARQEFVDAVFGRSHCCCTDERRPSLPVCFAQVPSRVATAAGGAALKSLYTAAWNVTTVGRTCVVEGSTSPVWSASMSFHVELDNVVVVDCWDADDAGGRNEHMGCVILMPEWFLVGEVLPGGHSDGVHATHAGCARRWATKVWMPLLSVPSFATAQGDLLLSAHMKPPPAVQAAHPSLPVAGFGSGAKPLGSDRSEATRVRAKRLLDVRRRRALAGGRGPGAHPGGRATAAPSPTTSDPVATTPVAHAVGTATPPRRVGADRDQGGGAGSAASVGATYASRPAPTKAATCSDGSGGPLPPRVLLQPMPAPPPPTPLAVVVSRHAHVHTKYCDRDNKVCTADGRWREGEVIQASVRGVPKSALRGSTCEWHCRRASDPADTPFLPTGPVEWDALYPPALSSERAALAQRDPSALSSTAGASIHLRSTLDRIRKRPLLRYLSCNDAGCLLKAVVTLANGDTVSSAAVGPVEPGPPHARELFIEGDCRPHSLLIARLYYFGGVEGASTYTWLGVSPEGDRVELKPPTPCEPGVTLPIETNVPARRWANDARCFMPEPAHVGWHIKVRVVPRRGDGEEGYPLTSKPVKVA